MKILCHYVAPVGANTLTFKVVGERLDPEDFDAMEELLAMFRKQFERAIPQSFIDGMADIEAGRVVPMEVALTQKPPTETEAK